MAKYLFFPPADKAQDDIWDYTKTTWGENQAKTYIRGLHQHLQKLADKQKVWHLLPRNIAVPPDLKIEAFFSQYKHHYIFFRKLSGNRIGIMSILHERADIPVRLESDLNNITSQKPS